MEADIFNRKKIYTEETLSFWLFPHNDEGLPIASKDNLEILSGEYLAHLFPYTSNYIWNNESFSLHVKMEMENEGSAELPFPHLSGTLSFGDYTEDEWFIVFLLLELTRSYKGLVCRMVDNDGEFLLIEAADALPEWMDPETVEQRVYLAGGKVHVIPVASSPSTLSPLPVGTPEVMDAVSAVATLPSSTLASSAIQDAIQMKIADYPGKISKDQHVAHAHVPVGVAALLREYPTLVAPAVRAFCRRDQKDNKALRVMRHFPPEMRVLTSVRFSKALYAQICAHPYTPDPRTGWGKAPQAEKALQAHQLGIKLACGFEILVCSAGGVTPSTPETPSQSDELDNLDTNPKWIAYKESLLKKGYFRGELEGSKLCKELETNARQYFVSNVLTGNDDNDEIVVGSVVVKLLNKVNTDYEFFKEREARLVPPDDESWLEISPKSLDQMLSSKFTPGDKASNEMEIGDSLNKFLGHMSDMDGAEIPPELHDVLRRTSSDRKTSLNTKKTSQHSRNASISGRRISSTRKTSLQSNPQYRKISSQSTTSQGSNSSDMSSFSTKIDMNSDAFTDGVHNMLDLNLPEDEYWDQSDEDSSGMSSYGGDHQDPREIEDLEDEDDKVTRKTSNGSQDSGVTNGTDLDIVECMEQMEKDLSQTQIGEMLNCNKETKVRKTHKGKKYRKKSSKIPLANMNEEFDDGDKDGPLDIDMEAVRNIVKAYSEEGGIEGPTTALLGSIGARPQPAK